jgi:hypothetical protein
VTPANLIARLRARGVELVATRDRLRFRPADWLTADELAALRAHKAKILTILRAEAETPVPSGPCGLCGGVLAFVEGWPTAGDARWLCPHCATQPAPSLAAVFVGLTTKELHLLKAGAALGDELAVGVIRELRGTRRAAA